jgi:hypothetical protein
MGAEYSSERLTACNPEEIADIVASVGTSYGSYRQVIVSNGVSGVVIADCKNEGELLELLSDLGISKLHTKILLSHFRRIFLSGPNISEFTSLASSARASSFSSPAVTSFVTPANASCNSASSSSSSSTSSITPPVSDNVGDPGLPDISDMRLLPVVPPPPPPRSSLPPPPPPRRNLPPLPPSSPVASARSLVTFVSPPPSNDGHSIVPSSVNAVLSPPPSLVNLRSPLPHLFTFLSHDWGRDELNRNNHDRVCQVSEGLRKRGIYTWLGNGEMIDNDIYYKVTENIKKTSCVIIFVTNRYVGKVNKALEVGNVSEIIRDNCKVS